MSKCPPSLGSIPAHAGEPTRPVSTGPAREVYPRPRGGAFRRFGEQSARGGLSPPTRGSLCRAIPYSCALRVYPRPRGGAASTSDRGSLAWGLSPPTRGSPCSGCGSARRTRSIPAHAGEPSKPRCFCALTRVYPRPRGGAASTSDRGSLAWGLSPPTRGSPCSGCGSARRTRSIPAHAGEPAGPFRDGRFSGVYPRPRGGARASRNAHAPILGLSPPTRGSRLRVGRGRVGVGSIPAHAGEPPSSSSGISIPRVYPRPRGGARTPGSPPPGGRGLSPPTRGSRFHHQTGRVYDGSIPAHAGEPPGGRRCTPGPWVYPRPRGGAVWKILGLLAIGGLSPPTRGSRSCPACGSAVMRSIPAHAGEPPYRVSMAIERCTLLAIEKCTLGIGCRGGSEATGAGTDAWMWSPFMTSPLSWSSRRPPPWRPWGGWTWRVPCDAASGSCCPGC